MKKKILYLLLTLCLVLTVFGVMTACGESDSSCSHEWQEATCTKAKTCQKCGATEGSANASAHTYGAWATIKQPSCTETGTNSRTCTGCGAVDQVTTPVAHAFGEFEIITPVSCENNGLREKTCALCEHVEQEILTATGHTFGAWETMVYATCIDEGEQQKHCACGETVTEEIPAKGHTDKDGDDKCDTCQRTMPDACECAAFETVDKVVVKATCTEAGEGAYIKRCIECGKEDSRQSYTIPATGHTESVIPAIPVTCTTNGTTEGKRCSACKVILTQPEEISALGHGYGEWKTLEAESCTEDGVRQRVCGVCHDVNTEVIPATGHTETLIPAVKESCTSVGYTEGAYCSVCHATIKAAAEIPMAPHAYGDWVTVKAQSCTEDGEAQRACFECHKTETKVITAEGHERVTIPAKEATCTADGYTASEICSVCDEIFVKSEVIEASGHTEITTPAKEPTCLEAGSTEGVYCSACGEVIKEAVLIPAKDHVIEFIPAVSAGCATEGHTYGMQCTVCEKYFEEPKTVPATGLHADGNADNACDSCGKSMGTDVQKTPAVTVESITAYAGEKISVNIKIANNPGIASAVLTLSYGEGLTLTELKLGDAFGALAFTSPDSLESGLCGLVWGSGKTEAADDGVIVSLIFALANDAAGKINVSISGTAADANGNTVAFETVNGFVTVEGTAVCNHEVSIIPATAASCTEDGSTAGAVCSLCQAILVKPVTVPATGHNEKITPAKAPTCTEDGYSEGTKCASCGEVIKYPEIYFATGHNTEIIPGVGATCIASGYTDGLKCSVCDMILQEREKIPATGHKSELIPEVEPSCTAEGYTAGERCSVCYAIIRAPEKTPAKGHEHGEWYTETKATCVQNGVNKQICRICGDANTEIIPANGHKKYDIPAKDATCTSTGNTAGSACSACGVFFTAPVIVPVKDHNEVIIPAVKATCTEKGYTEGSYCEYCKITIKESKPLSAKGHNYGAWVTVQKATCTENGLNQQSCYECGAVNSVSIPATGHKLANGQCTACGWISDSKTENLVNKLTGTSISELLAEIKERYENAPVLDINALLEGVNLYAEVPAEKTFVSVNGGYVTVTDENGDMYIGLSKGHMVYVSGGQIVNSEQVLPDGLGELSGDLDQTIAMIEEMVNSILALNYLPEIEAEDFVSEDGWFFLTDSYIEELAKGIVYVVYTMTEETELTAEMKAQLDARVEQMLAEVDLKIGLAMDGDNINGVILSLSIKDSEAFEITGSVDIAVEAKLSADLTKFDYFEVALDINDTENGLREVITLSSNAKYNNDGSCVIESTITADIQESEYITNFNAQAKAAFNADGLPTSVEFTADVFTNGNDLGGTSISTENGYAYIRGKSDSRITISLNADLASIESGNANAAFSMNMVSSNARLVVDHISGITEAEALAMISEEERARILDLYDSNGGVTVEIKAADNKGVINITYTDGDGKLKRMSINAELNSDKAQLPPEAVIELIKGFEPPVGCQHEWASATCLSPSYCVKCAQTNGPALGHYYENGYCLRCGESEAHMHNYVLSDSAAPTCTEAGYKSYICACGMGIKEMLPATGHSYDEKGYCADCGAFGGDIELPHEHTYETVEYREPTCTENGYVIMMCTGCGMKGRDDLLSKGHSFTDDGYCTECGAFGGDAEQPHEHRFKTLSTVNPTCTESGYVEMLCAECDMITKEEIPATGHIYDEKGYCAVCGAFGGDAEQPHEHTYEAAEYREPTCTEDGYIIMRCTYCGDTMTEKFDAIGHSFTEDGYCVNCKGYIGDFDVHEHIFVILEYRNPTCTEGGHEVRECTGCGEMQKNELPAIGHSFDEDGYCINCGMYIGGGQLCEHEFETQYMRAPTCTEDGQTVYSCVYCGMSMVETISAMGHSINENEICVNCGENLHEHSYTETGRSEPACLTDGEAAYVCYCGATLTRVLYATNHYYTENGICGACGAVQTENGIAADRLNSLPLVEIIDGLKQYTEIDIATMISDINLYLNVPAQNTVVSINNGYITVKDEYGDTYISYKDGYEICVNQYGISSEKILPTAELNQALDTICMYVSYILEMGYLPTVNENDVICEDGLYRFTDSYIAELVTGAVYTAYTMTEGELTDEIKAQLQGGIDMLLSEIDIKLGFYKDADAINGIFASVIIDDTTNLTEAAGSLSFEFEARLSDDLTKPESVRAIFNLNDQEAGASYAAALSANLSYSDDGTYTTDFTVFLEEMDNGERMYVNAKGFVVLSSEGVLQRVVADCNYSNSAEPISSHGTGGNGWSAYVMSVSDTRVSVYVNADISDIKNGNATGTLRISSTATNERFISEITVYDPNYATDIPTEDELLASISEERKQEMLDTYYDNFSEEYVLSVEGNKGTIAAIHTDADGHNQNMTVNIELNSDKAELPPAEIMDAIQNYVPGTDEDNGNNGEVVLPNVPAEPHEHTYEEVEYREPTCTESGIAVLQCLGCGIMQKEEIPATGHKYTENGVCVICGAGIGNEGGEDCVHKFYRADNGKYPSCTSEGREVQVCEYCGLQTDVTISALGHCYNGYGVCVICGESGDIEERPSYIPAEAVKFGNSYYLIVVQDITRRHEAQEACEAMGGMLACITSAEEQTFAELYNYYGKSLWIGGYRDLDGSWKWISGETWDYTCWGYGEPNNSSAVVSNERYVTLWPYLWNDLANDNIYEQDGFLCEWKIEDTECGHEYVSDIVEPTCTSSGFTVYTCTKCSHYYTDYYVSATAEHRDINDDFVCEECGEYFGETDVSPEEGADGGIIILPTVPTVPDGASDTFIKALEIAQKTGGTLQEIPVEEVGGVPEGCTIVAMYNFCTSDGESVMIYQMADEFSYNCLLKEISAAVEAYGEEYGLMYTEMGEYVLVYGSAEVVKLFA